MLSKKGYSLVGCTMNGNNAFFVKTELMQDHCEDASAENHYEPQRFWLTKAFISGYSFRDRPNDKKSKFLVDQGFVMMTNFITVLLVLRFLSINGHALYCESK